MKTFSEAAGKWVLLGTAGESRVFTTLAGALWKNLAETSWFTPFIPLALLLSLYSREITSMCTRMQKKNVSTEILIAALFKRSKN